MLSWNFSFNRPPEKYSEIDFALDCIVGFMAGVFLLKIIILFI